MAEYPRRRWCRAAALLTQGAQERALAGPHDVWRLRVPGANAAFWDNGTLYLVAREPMTPEAPLARAVALEIAGSPFASTTAGFLVGFDESGKRARAARRYPSVLCSVIGWPPRAAT